MFLVYDGMWYLLKCKKSLLFDIPKAVQSEQTHFYGCAEKGKF